MTSNLTDQSLVDIWTGKFSSLSETIPSISEILQEGRAALAEGKIADCKGYDNLIVLLRNSHVSVDTEIASDVEFAQGGVGVVIDKQARVGKGVTLAERVLLVGTPASNSAAAPSFASAAPTVCDHVYIAAGAQVLGAVTVGSLSIIGPNAVVSTNVPPLSIVSGISETISKQIHSGNCLVYKDYFKLGQGMSDQDFTKLVSYLQNEIEQNVNIDIATLIDNYMQGLALSAMTCRDQNLAESHGITSLYEERLLELRSTALVTNGRTLINEQVWDAGGYYKPVELVIPVDWTMDPFNDRTWRWFLHQFEFSRSLLAFDLAERKFSGYRLLKQFVQSWSAQYLHDLSDTDSVWHDHGTALRARNLLLLLAYMKQSNLQEDGFFSELVDILKQHALVLLEDKFYSKGTNHGLDQNIVLFEILKELDFQIPGALQKASDRVNYEISKAFASDGGHIENSAAYLTFGLKQAVDALHIGRSYDGESSLIRLPDGMLERATAALTHTVRPDNKLPLVGDTCDYVVRDIFRDVKPENYGEFLYSIHRGTRGTAPRSTDLVLQESGWAILRSSWNNAISEKFTDQLHCVFKCGFLSNYHRHDDDLSFVLFNKGKDWIVEGGLYKHSRTDPYRLYFRSAQAHNISMPFRGRASRVLEASNGTGITFYDRVGPVSTVRAQSSMFTGYDSTRQLAYNRENNTIRIVDTIIPVAPDKQQYMDLRVKESAFTYVTRFLVPENKTIDFNKRTGICTIRDGSDTLSIACNGGVQGFKITVGETKPEIKGWISHRPNKLKHCQVIEFFHRERSLNIAYELSWS